MISFIDEHQAEHGVESICKELPVSPSTYYECKAREDDPERLPDRIKRDRSLELEIKRVWEENFQVYGARKVWRQLNREQIVVARCTVERLMKRLGLQGATRRAKCWTTVSDDALSRPADLVKRQFTATRPNQLWVADITFVATWSGFVYVAFVIDVFARYIVGWRVSRSLHTELVLDALEQALWSRATVDGLVHHSDSEYMRAGFSGGLSHIAIDASRIVGPVTSGWPDPHSDRPKCHSPDLSATRGTGRGSDLTRHRDLMRA